MLVAVDAPDLHMSQTIAFTILSLDLLMLNKVSSLCCFLLAHLAERFCIVFIVDFDINEITRQKFVEET